MAAKTPRKVCTATCAPLVAAQCAALRKKKMKRCRARLWTQCQRDRIDCTATTTTTTLPTTPTTLPPSGPGCATTFQLGPELPGGAEHVATGDLNGDGRLDWVMTANPGVMVRLGNGDGTFGGIGGYTAGGDPGGVAVADLDGDGIADLAVPHFTSQPMQVADVAVLRGLGGGAFADPVDYRVGTRDFHDVVAADLDGDGRPDLAVATHPSVVVLRNAGNGTFVTGVEYPVPSLGRAVAAADLNGDGRLDLAATGAGGPSGPGVVAIFLGTGGGVFGAPVSYPVGRVPYSIVAGDVNGDGAVDLATANNNSADVDGTLTGGSAALATGDFDGDGKDDVALASGRAHRVLLSRCP